MPMPLAYPAAMIAASILALLPAVAAGQTITVPEEEFEDLQEEIDEFRGMEMPEIDFSSPAGMLETFEAFAGSDMVEAMGLGWKRDVVWEMDISGSWSETVSGQGEIVHWRAGEDGAILNAQLRDGRREAPLIVGVMADGVIGTHYQDGNPDVGIGTIDNHFFEPDRIFGHARDSESMRAPGFSGLEEIVDEYDQTMFYGSRIEVLEAGETDDGSESWHIRWTSTLQEEDQFGNPTGRMASVRGWLCDAASYEDDPEACRREDFDLLAKRPADERTNVNPEDPGIVLTFTQPADIASLDEHFGLFTRDQQGQSVIVDGEWSREGEAEYHFIPDEPLRPGVRYNAHIRSGEAPDQAVRAADAGQPLDASVAWEFTTLLNLAEQGVGAAFEGGPDAGDDHPLSVDVYQVAINPRLTRDKPALSRIRAAWEKHEDIHPAYQPDSFEMAIDITPEHGHIVGQDDGLAWSGQQGRVVELIHQNEFDDWDAKAMRHTINAFGWRPQGEHSQIEVTLEPEDPYPEQLEEAVTTAVRDLRHWGHDPGDLRFFFSMLDVGDWGSPETEALTPINWVTLWDKLHDGHNIPDDIESKVAETVHLVEQYIPQFMPHRAGRGAPTNMVGNEGDLFISKVRDPRFAMNDLLHAADGCHDWDIHPFVGACISNTSVIAAYLRLLQSRLGDGLDREDFVVLFVPDGTLGPGTAGVELTIDSAWAFEGFTDLKSRAVIVEVQENLSAEELAVVVVHEMAHGYGLHHNPGHAEEVGPISGYVHESIEGFRMDHTGRGGHNKSAIEGNEEEAGTLAPLMWPLANPSRRLMTTPDELRKLQDGIEAGF